MGKLEDFIARGTVSAANGAKPMRELQINLLASEMRDEVEHAEPYGFTSEPGRTHEIMSAMFLKRCKPSRAHRPDFGIVV